MKKKIISFLLVAVMIFQMLPLSVLPAIAIGESDSVIGKTGKLNVTSGSVYMYESVYEYGGQGRTSNIRVSEMPELFVILDTYYAPGAGASGRTYYKLGQLEGGQYHTAFDATPWINGELVDIVEEPEHGNIPAVTLNGGPVTEIKLYEDGKMPLKATKPAEIKGEAKWSWQILVKDKWITIGDKDTDTCNVTYALVVNILDENRETKLRVIANDGEKDYISDPITVKMQSTPAPMLPEYENAPDSVAKYAGERMEDDRVFLSTSTEQITITVNFIKVRPDGTRAEAAYPDIRTLKVGGDDPYEGYVVTLPSVLGYYPSMVEPSNPYDFSQNPDKDPGLTTVSIPAGETADQTINVYYYPGEQDYIIYHYFQNKYDDEYDDAPPIITEGRGTVGTIVPDDCHQTKHGYRALYYERPEIATDGSTVVEIYYDREYFAVLFELDKKGAYGPENLYVKYETVVGLRDPQCPGWTFSSWEQAIFDANGTITGYKTTDYTAGKTNQHEVTESVTFRAVWTGTATTYSVVYWLENPNDGNYSVWFTEDNLSATSGGFKKWNGVIPEDITKSQDYKFVTLNTTKTEEDWDTVDGVLIEGDGSSTVDVYFNRRVYAIDFLTSPKTNLNHDHNDSNDPCEYNTMYCTDPTHTEHTHTSACGAVTCTQPEHMHGVACCDTHMHTADCFDNVQPLSALGGALKDKIINEKAAENWISKIASWIGIDAKSWVAERLEGSAGTEIQKVTDSEIQKLITMEPPQNLKTGFIYAKSGVDVNFSYTYDAPWYLGGGGTDTYSGKFSYTVVYIDNENGDTSDDWYYYSASGTTLNTGDVITAKCGNPDHDHTSGCTYGTKCKVAEHVHINSCYASCSDTGAQHTADCYGNVCMKPVTKTYSGKTGVTDGTYTVISIQAKYGQDITEILPYYLELSEQSLNKNASGHNFTGWKYAGTGWAQTNAVTRYVKHVTMVEELCYSAGVTATAEYSASATNAYLLYYLFESFDQSSGAKDYALDGNGRYQYSGKWYDSDPVHMQLIMLPSAGGIVDGGQKEILGMTYVGMERGNLTLDLGTISPNLSGINAETLNAYFYQRKTDNKVVFHNGGQVIQTIPAEGKQNPLKFGLLLGDLALALKNSADYGNFDVNNVPYPSTLEENAYVFDGWYTTPYQSDYTKVDWETTTLPEGELNLYAHWRPVIRYVEVYEDSTLTTQFAADNKGSQEVGHRSYAIAPDYSLSEYAKDGYRFDGWFYVDPENPDEEKAFLFNFPVTQDMKIYAKWTLDVIVPYEIHYVVESPKGSGNYVNVAKSLIGTEVAGRNKTFRAATGTELYSEFSEGFFPRIGSHTLQMTVTTDGDGNVLPNVYTFVYDEVEMIDYWVKFVDNETGEEFDYTDPRYPKAINVQTRKAAVTEIFVPIEGYTVDKYSKSLILTTEDPENNNVITFYYDPIEEDAPITAPWIINHMIQNVNGSYSVYQQIPHEDIVKPGDNHEDVYFGTVLDDINAYTFYTAEVKTRRLDPVTGEIEDVIIRTEAEGLHAVMQNDDRKFGYELNEFGMEINLYYNRDKVGYTVEYKADTGEVFYRYTVPADESVQHGHNVTAVLDQKKHIEIVYNKGYQLVDDTQTSITMSLYIDESRNVITFLYQKFDATFEYQMVCDDKDSGVGLSMTREVIPAGSANALTGAIPYESATYYFAGWYADEACTQPINAETVGNYSVILEAEELSENYSVTKLTPTKTEFTYEGTSGNLYLSATYYALFLPRSADLTIKVDSGARDSFVLNFEGQADTFAEGKNFSVVVIDGVMVTVTDVPIGSYTVTLDQNWSWRYPTLNGTVDVQVSVGGSLSLTLTPDETKWLTDDGYGIHNSN